MFVAKREVIVQNMKHCVKANISSDHSKMRLSIFFFSRDRQKSGVYYWPQQNVASFSDLEGKWLHNREFVNEASLIPSSRTWTWSVSSSLCPCSSFCRRIRLAPSDPSFSLAPVRQSRRHHHHPDAAAFWPIHPWNYTTRLCLIPSDG